MKKILGVSFAAMLAVTPMMAMADPAPTPDIASEKIDGITASADVASTSYVKGAYNAAIDAVGVEELRAKGVEGDLSNLNANIDAENLVGAINAVYTAATTADGVQSVTTGTTDGTITVDDTEVAVAGLGSAAFTDSSAYDVAGAAAAEQTRATGVEGSLSNLSNDFTSEQKANLVTAINAAMSAAKTVDGVQSVTTGTTNGTITVDNTEVSVAGLGSAAYTASTAYDAAGSAAAAETAAKAYADDLVTNQATKEGVVATINHSTASGTITVYDDWSDASSSQNITVSSTVTAPATNAYYATLGAQSGTTQTDSTPAPSETPGV